MADRNLHGVGGWLSLLVFSLGIISPLLIIITTGARLNISAEAAQALGFNWTIYKIASWLLSLATLTASAYLGFRLKEDHRRSTAGLAIKGIWVIGWVPPLLDLLLRFALFPHLAASVLDGWLIADIAKALVFPPIWSLYLITSKRVTMTYVESEIDARRIFG